MEQRAADESADILQLHGDRAQTTSTTVPPPLTTALPATPQEAVPARPRLQTRRQGIDLRPEDDVLIEGFELFVLRHRRALQIRNRKGLSLYARAGFALLDSLIRDDPDAAIALLRRAGGASANRE